MRVLVTGGLGDVGRYLLLELIAAGHQVRCLDIRNWVNVLTARRLRANGVEIRWGDVRCEEDVACAVADQQAVIHLAAVIPPRSEVWPDRAESVNVHGTRNVLDAMEASPLRPRLVYVSSVAVFGLSAGRLP